MDMDEIGFLMFRHLIFFPFHFFQLFTYNLYDFYDDDS